MSEENVEFFRMKKCFIFLLILLLSTNAYSQDRGFLMGKIFDKNNDGVCGVLIVIKHNENIITNCFSDIYGLYKISIVAGNYDVEFLSLGYAKEKQTVEIISGKTIKLDIQISEERFDIATVYDTIRLNAIELNKIDEKFKLVIDNHIKNLRKKSIFNSAKKNIIIVNLSNRNYYYYEKFEVENMSLKHQKFQNNEFGDGYNITINVIGKNNEPIQILNYYRKVFHHKYKKWDIFFVTQIEDLKFPFAEGQKNYEYYTKYEDIVSSKNGKYKIGDTKLNDYWNKGIIYKRYEIFETNYFISDFEVIFKIDKSKCLICKPIIL